MRVVAALGGTPCSAGRAADSRQPAERHAACGPGAARARHELVITHGNGPQVGLLALHGAYTGSTPYPLDVLGAQTEGMIGYLIQQELGRQTDIEKRLASLLTLIEVNPDDPAFERPDEADRPDLRRGTGAQTTRPAEGLDFKPDGDSLRRVVPSPGPAADLGLEPYRGCSPSA